MVIVASFKWLMTTTATTTTTITATTTLAEWCFRLDSALKGYTGPGTTWVNKRNFVMNHAPGAGLIAEPVDL